MAFRYGSPIDKDLISVLFFVKTPFISFHILSFSRSFSFCFVLPIPVALPTRNVLLRLVECRSQVKHSEGLGDG